MISEFPLLVFTTLAGLAAGSYTMSAFFPVGQGSKRPWLFPLVCLVLLAAGLLCLPAHLEHPERMLIALSNPSAMIAQEAYWSIGFGIVLLADVVLSKAKGASPRALRIVGAVAGLGLACVMANAYFVSSAIVPWASWETFPLFRVGDLAMGAAFCALFERGLYEKTAFAAGTAVLGLLTCCAAVAEAVRFAGLGLGAAPFVVGAGAALAGAVCAALAGKGKLPAKAAGALVFACLLAAVVVSRYAFYAVGGM